MNILETYYTYAKLSQAAYIDLSPSLLSVGDDPKNPDIIVNTATSPYQSRMPESIGQQFFGSGQNPSKDHWKILSPYHLEKGTHLFLEDNGDCYAKKGESFGTKLPTPYSTERA
ncbi:MAG: hypothetical protein ABW166_10390 [Sedimenticola sp.]